MTVGIAGLFFALLTQCLTVSMSNAACPHREVAVLSTTDLLSSDGIESQIRSQILATWKNKFDQKGIHELSLLLF